MSIKKNRGGAIQFALKTGKQQGIQQERRETARKMLADGFDPAMIMKYTGLSAEEVAALTKEVEKELRGKTRND